MADEAPAEGQDQPTTPPEQTDQGTEPSTPQEEQFSDFDATQIPEDANREWLAERYKQMQADYTQKTQGVAEQRREAEQMQQFLAALQDPETQAEALSQLGLELEQEQQYEQEWQDPDEQLQARVDQLEAFIAQQGEEAQLAQWQDAEAAHIDSALSALEEQIGRQFDNDEVEFIFDYATQNRHSDGEPDVKGAFEKLTAIYDRRQKDYIASKNAPRKPGSGTSASQTVDLSNEEERQRVMAEAADAAMASE